MKIIKILFVYLTSLFLFFFNLPIIFFLLFKKKFFNKKIFILREAGGFGHTIIFPIIIERLFDKKNSIYISFHEKERHNEYFSKYLDFDNIQINTRVNINIKFLKKKIIIGERENQKYSPTFFFFINLIKYFKGNFAQIYTAQDVYKLLIHNEKIKSNSKSFSDLRDLSLFKMLEHKKFKSNLFYNTKSKLFLDNLQKEINFPIGSYSILYLRQKGVAAKKNESEYMKVGSDIIDYYQTIKYLNSKNVTVLIIGDIESFNFNLLNELKFFTYRSFKINRDLFDYLAVYKSNWFIGEQGGASYLSIFFNKPLIVNAIENFQMINAKILYKNLYKKNYINRSSLDIYKFVKMNFND